jgi:tetratricopeptide (TPR) repeat protein
VITAFFAIWLSGYKTGLTVLFLFAVSPTFMGHSLNNLKDIPFSLSYIAAIYFTVQVLLPGKKISFTDIFLMVLSIAFSISIRAGGLLLICYLFLFFILFYINNIARYRKHDIRYARNGLIIIVIASIAGFFLGILLWPYALQSPFKNVIESYRIMAHYPDTFRQIFEGKIQWSDFMPWYYLPKSMAITIPVIVIAGTLLLLLFLKRISASGKSLLYAIILFTILFPLLFAIAEGSNVYSSWRQFLFVYPPIVLLAAAGFSFLYDSLGNKLIRLAFILILCLASVHPVRFMILNHPYEYLYYNQLTSGLKGANGNYETDYYYVSQTEASEWLIRYLANKKTDTAIVRATFSVDWQFRNYPDIKTAYFRNEERSHYDWDYAIITNRYIPPYKLKTRLWPPENAIHTIYADSVPICAVLERKTKTDYLGYKALEDGRIKDALICFEEAVKFDNADEMIFYNFARALFDDGQYEKADSLLKKGLELNPEFEPGLMYLGNIAKSRNEPENASEYYEKVIRINRKYFKAYVELAGLVAGKDILQARKLLRDCLTINPKYKPAIIALADTYRTSDPVIAEKYYKQAEKVK